MDVIDGLLRIKRIREDSREADMRRAKQQLEVAAAALRQAADLQRERDRERAEREQALYEDVCSRVIVVRDLDDLRYEVGEMKTAAKVDEQAVVDAKAQRVTRRQAFDEASSVWRLAAQATKKFEDLSEEQRLARERHTEWLADLELEEHPAGKALALSMEDDTEEA